jgi:hypothetical protein
MTRRASIDRFEGDRVILVVEGREEARARAEVPPDAREGDVVDLDAMKVDREATEALKREVSDARARLKRDPNPGSL